MKSKIVNIMATTGLTLIVLALFGALSGAGWLAISSVFESLAANIVIHLGFLLTQRFESRYLLLDCLLDIACTALVLIVFGAVFDWYGSTPVWMLLVMAALIYGISLFFNIVRAREEIKKINRLLEKRNQQVTPG